MKRLFSMVLGLAVAAGAVLGSDGLSQLTMTISTPGPDYYKDGSKVKDGETYLLVYLKTTNKFYGVRMNGSLVDPVNNVIAAVGHAKNYACAFQPIQYSTNLYPSTGRWVIDLLDTRTANGTVGGLVVGNGASQSASSPSATAPTVVDYAATMTGSNATLASTVIAPPLPGTPAPVITSITQKNGATTVKFNNLINGNNYYLQEVASVGNSWTTTPVVNPIPCVQSDALIEVEVPAVPGQTTRFFRIVTPLP